VILQLRVRKGEEPSGEEVLRLIQDPFSDAKFAKNLACSSSTIAAGANRRFKFDKRIQLFIRTHNVTLSVAAMRVSNPDRSSVRIEG
jgi:hypothetical protein